MTTATEDPPRIEPRLIDDNDPAPVHAHAGDENAAEGNAALIAALEQAKAALEQANARIEQANAEVAESKAEIEQVKGELEQVKAELEQVRPEAAAMRDQALRALAEAENTRRRSQRDREEFARYAAAPLAKEVLPVADNLARALAAVPAEALASDEALKNLVDGIAATERQLLAGFERHSIKRIDPMGEKFDSHQHQAMFEVPGTGQPAGTIVQVLQPGYLLHDRLLRPALVGVAKAEPAGDSRVSGDGSPEGTAR
jgi:molecular chaperone GrpE